MTGSAFAECLLYIDDFTVTPDQLGTRIDLCIKARFSARVSAWQLDLEYPEGITPVHAKLGADGHIPYIDDLGDQAVHTPQFYKTADYSRLIAATDEVGYWYDDSGDLTSYGMIKWEGGTYEEMVILRVEVSEDFQGGQIVMNTQCSSTTDARGGTIRENGDHGVTFTYVCNISGAPEAYACYTPSNTTLTFYYDGMRDSRPGTTYDLNTGYNDPRWYSDGTYSSVTRVVFDSSFSDARPTTTNYWFINMSKLTTITGLANLNTSQVTIMSLMFYGCSSLTSLDLSNFNTANVTSLMGMFNGCRNLTYLDVSSFNTAKVNTMSSIFAYCEKLTSLDLSNFITSNLTNMVAMFSGCSSLTSLDVSSFNSANVTDMSYMFDGCSSLTSLNVSSFNTSNVTDMRDMFYDCSSLTSLDLSSFNTANVTNMGGMFGNCGNLVTIYAGSGWSTDAVTYSNSMFSNCYKLVGGAGTTYHYTHTDAAYAHIDGGTSNPGYFSEKSAFLRGDVNGDGQVNITDVTILINYLLSHNATGVILGAADCNESGTVNISDVTVLINYLLSKQWSW